MLEEFDIHARIIGDFREAHRLISMMLKKGEKARRNGDSLGFDFPIYERSWRSLKELILILGNNPLPPVEGERIVDIASRLNTTPRMVIKRIIRRREKGHKIVELWRDERGLIFPPGVFRGEKIKHRTKRPKPTARKR